MHNKWYWLHKISDTEWFWHHFATLVRYFFLSFHYFYKRATNTGHLQYSTNTVHDTIHWHSLIKILWKRPKELFLNVSISLRNHKAFCYRDWFCWAPCSINWIFTLISVKTVLVNQKILISLRTKFIVRPCMLQCKFYHWQKIKEISK